MLQARTYVYVGRRDQIGFRIGQKHQCPTDTGIRNNNNSKTPKVYYMDETTWKTRGNAQTSEIIGIYWWA